MIQFHLLHPRATTAMLGFIPEFLSADNPASAREQLHTNYAHGGGWFPFEGFELGEDDSLTYPGDPPYLPLARAKLRDETILVYPHAWVAIVQPDRSYEVARMD